MKAKLGSFILIAFFLLSCSNEDPVNKDVLPEGYNPVVAHRGAWLEYKLPENSIASLEKAIELKCIGSEFDVRMTEDDSLVICHDAYFNGLQIEKSKYKDLIGFKLSNGENIPTLRQYFITAKKQKLVYTKLFCEIKPSDISESRGLKVTNKVYGLIQELNMKENVIILSFNFAVLKHIRELDSIIQLQFLSAGFSNEMLLKNNIAIDYNYNYYQLHEELIQFAKDNKIKLNVWTVNNPNMLDYFLSKNFDYITTDYPILLKKKIGF